MPDNRADHRQHGGYRVGCYRQCSGRVQDLVRSEGRLKRARDYRHQLTRSKAIRALRELDAVGTPVNFEAVARAADVSRSWLYAQPDIRAEIQRLRQATRRAPNPAIPAGQRASGASLLARLDATVKHNRKLAVENQQLRRQLAQALGEQRAAAPSPRRQPAETGNGASPFNNDQSPVRNPGTSCPAASATTSVTHKTRSGP
jgi:Family of unknown function (DUF6262)